MPSAEAILAARKLVGEALRKHGVQQRDEFLALLRPGAAGADCGIDRIAMAQVGGDPLMVANMEWPVRPAYSREFSLAYKYHPEIAGASRPLDFICEVDLGAVAMFHDLPLPTTGMLSLFYDSEIQPWVLNHAEMAGVRLLWQNAPPSTMTRAVAPKEATRFRARPMSFSQGWMLPGWGQGQVASLAPFQSAECEALLEYEKEVREQHSPVTAFADAGGLQVGGWPNLVQGPQESTCEALRREGLGEGLIDWPRRAHIPWQREDWRLVLQVDSEWCMENRAEGDAEMMWGDMGMLYVWMRWADIEAGRFDQAILQLQCT